MIALTKTILRNIIRSGAIEGLTGPQLGILVNLRNRGPQTPSELSDLMIVTQGNITGLTQRLKKNGLVEIRRSSSDRRVLKIAISKQGIERLDFIVPTWEKKITESFSCLEAGDQKAFHSLLSRICESLDVTSNYLGTSRESK